MNEDILDRSFIDSLKELDEPGSTESVLRDLVTLYNKNAPVQIANIVSAVKAADFEKARREAHSLKSSSANLGGVRVSAKCKAIEGMKTNDGLAMEKLAKELEAEYALFRVALEKEAQ